MSRFLLALACLFSLSCGFRTKPSLDWPAPDEKELFSVCWREGLPYALVPEACENPETIEWDHSPVVVTSEPDLSGLVVASVDAWNEQLGFELFRWDRLNPDADVIVTRGGPHALYRGLAQHSKNADGSLHCSILIFDDAVYSMDTMIHELGHAVGLEHDPKNRRSVMYPSSAGRYLPDIEPADLRVLRRRYRS